MKKILSAFGMAFLLVSLTACSDDDADKQAVYESKTFTDATGLTLTVNDQPMIGKTVAFTTSDADATKGTITLSSTFDLSAIPGITLPGVQTIEGPGVIPGSKSLKLDIDLNYDDSSKAQFSGSESTEYCTFNYNGTVNNDALVLNITNLELKNKRLVGQWVPVPVRTDDDFDSDTYGQLIESPIHVVWESNSKLNFLGSELPIADLLKLVMIMPLLDDNTKNLPQALESVLKQVEFMNDGNIIASYVDVEAENGAVSKSPFNMAQYVVTGDNTMRFFLNPQAVIAADGEESRVATRDLDINNLLGNVMTQLVPMMADGVPMRYEFPTSTTPVIYLDTEVLLPLLKQVSPLLRDEALVNQLVELVKQNESMGFIADSLPAMMASMADVIDNTTKIQIGLNFKAAN